MGKYIGNENFDVSTVTNAKGMHTDAGAKTYTQGKEDFASNKEVGSNLQNQSSWQRNVQDAYDEEQKRRASSGMYGQNLAQNNPLGNLNQKSFEDTQYASRLADAFNAQRYYYGRQGGIGARGFNVQRGPGAIDLRDVKPVETQEMRQMRANEGIDAYARQRQAGLSADAAAHSLDLQRRADESVQNLAAMFGVNQADLSKQFQELNASLNWESPTRLAQSLYSQRAQQIVNAMLGEELGTKYMTMLKRTPMLANLISGRLGFQAFDRYSALLESAMEDANITDPTEAAQMYMYMRTMYDQIARMGAHANTMPFNTMYNQDRYLEGKFDKQGEVAQKAADKQAAKQEKKSSKGGA